MNKIKKFVKMLFLGYKCDSAHYIDYLVKNGASIGEGTTLYDAKTNFIDETRPFLINIGKNVQITKNVIILTHDYGWSVIKGMNGEILGSAGKVVIEDNVFIGMNTTILKDSYIGKNVIIGANSLVRGKLEDDSIYAGNPAKKIMSIEEYYQKRKKLQLDEAVMLFNEYYKKFNKVPEKKLFSEFVFLFEDRRNPLLFEFKEKMELQGNFDITLSAYHNTIPYFENYEQFTLYCIGNLNKVNGKEEIL